MIRLAQERDLPQLEKLLAQVNLIHHIGRPDLFKVGTKYSHDQLLELLGREESPVFVWTDGEDVARGHLFCAVKRAGDEIHTEVTTLHIDDLCVEEGLRGRGIGRALYEYAVEYGKALGCYNLTLNVWSCNPAAMGFYTACGMAPQRVFMETLLHQER